MTITKLGILKVIPIEKIVNETPDNSRIPLKSFTVKVPEIALQATPGQFIMMWLYGIDEKPMGIASRDKHTGFISLTVAKLGPATTAFHQMKEGELIGIRGPFGKGFTLQGKNVGIIGGGTGIAPIRFLIDEALKKGIKVTLFHGARTLNEFAFRKYFEDLEKINPFFTYEPSTDDGSYGFYGFSTQNLEHYLKMGGNFDQMYTCGPELMMAAVLKHAKTYKIPLEACLADRYFKCAIGLCGQCTVDPLGLRLCIDGPVFNHIQLEQITDFGKFARDKFGKKNPL